MTETVNVPLKRALDIEGRLRQLRCICRAQREVIQRMAVRIATLQQERDDARRQRDEARAATQQPG
jgi:hypothetical protein